MFVHAGSDLAGHLAETLCSYAGSPYTYKDPGNKDQVVDLAGVLAKAIRRKEASPESLREILLRDPKALGRVLHALSDRLPFALVLVIDQAEEVFTIPRKRASDPRESHLAMLRSLLDARGDFKVVISLRTEYYGRLVDRLRGGSKVVKGLNQYLLTELGDEDLVRVVERPTSTEPIRFKDEADVEVTLSPRECFRFSFAPRVAGYIVNEVSKLRVLSQDSVLPLLQVVCDQLRSKALARAREDDVREITKAMFDSTGGTQSGLRSHVESLVTRLESELTTKTARRSARKNRSRAKAPVRNASTIRSVLILLHVKQLDGLCTTAFLQETKLRNEWNTKNPNGASFDDFVELALKLRLLKLRTRVPDGKDDRFLGLGHDALAKVVMEWQLEAEARRARAKQRRESRLPQRPLAAPPVTPANAYLTFWQRLNPRNWW